MSQVRQNWRLWAGSFDTKMVFDETQHMETHTASTFGGDKSEFRRSRVGWLTGNQRITNAIMPYASDAASVMGIRIDGNCEIQFTEYHASEGGKYDWHHDVNWSSNFPWDRKLSLTIQLSDPSDYEGGQFEFMEVEGVPEIARQGGSVLVFPSYLKHRVLPVTRGTRRSLVAWFSGPRWS